jgi:peptidoglycan/LPS O-acetylase OafA/YrhL
MSIRANQDSSEQNLTTVDSVIWLNLIFVGVVLLLHHVNYTQDYFWAIAHRFIDVYQYKVDKLLQIFSVGGFLFLSGFKLAKSKSSTSSISFIKSRLVRIYPLYLLAVVVSSVTTYPYLTGQFPSIPNFLIHALCLQSILPDLFQANYHTIWFVSHLFCYYGLFLILRSQVKTPKTFFALVGLIIASIYGLQFLASLFKLKLFLPGFDMLFLFFPLGIFYAHHGKGIDRFKPQLLFLIAAVCLPGFVIVKNLLANDALPQAVLERCFAIGGFIPLYVGLLKVCAPIKVPQRVAILMQQLSVASFCAFLFHRALWAVLAQLWSQKSYAQSGLVLGIGIPLLFVSSYWLQVGYDRYILPLLQPQRKKTIPQI